MDHTYPQLVAPAYVYIQMPPARSRLEHDDHARTTFRRGAGFFLHG